MEDLKTLKERETQLSARSVELETAIRNGDDSAFLEFQNIADEFHGVQEAILQIEHAEEERIKAEKAAAEAREREAREAEIQKRIQETKEAAKAKVDAEIERLKNSSRRKNLAKNLLDKLEKVQIVPSTECIELNDKIIKLLFNLSDKQFEFMMRGGKFNIIEKRYSKKSKKHKDNQRIVSPFKMEAEEGYESKVPFTEFDRAVLGVVLSEMACDNPYSTVNVIFRALVGKVGEGDDGVRASKDQRDAILGAIEKLKYIKAYWGGAVESLKEMKYISQNGNEIKLKNQTAPLLYSFLADAKVNGQVMEDVIFFDDNSPLYYIADAKDQIIRYPHELLDVPGQNNTPLIIAIKKYVMRRICEIKAHKQLTPTITFNDVFKKCRVDDTTNPVVVKRRREYILKFFEHLKEQNFIKDFEVVKKKNVVYGIKFSY